MKIREVADHVGLSTEAIRYFEREGLVEPPSRGSNGYRCYSAAHLERLRFIANCRALEMSHDEIRQLIDAAKSPATECATAANVVRHHIEHVESRVAVLCGLLKVLKSIDASCAHDANVRACDVMRALAAPIVIKSQITRSHV